MQNSHSIKAGHDETVLKHLVERIGEISSSIEKMQILSTRHRAELLDFEKTHGTATKGKLMLIHHHYLESKRLELKSDSRWNELMKTQNEETLLIL